jgi:hypothetical protein
MRYALPSLEVGPVVLEFYCGEFAPQDLHKEVAAAARRLKEAGVNALRLTLHKVEHSLDQPRRGEDFSVVGNALSRLDAVHELTASPSRFGEAIQSGTRTL